MGHFIGHHIWRGTLCFIMVLGLFTLSSAFPSPPEDDRYLDREFASPGGHQLASWLVSQLRKGEVIPAPEMPILPYRLPLAGKRNSELTSSIMSIPRTMIDNGR